MSSEMLELHTELHGVTTQMTIIFILATGRHSARSECLRPAELECSHLVKDVSSEGGRDCCWHSLKTKRTLYDKIEDVSRL